MESDGQVNSSKAIELVAIFKIQGLGNKKSASPLVEWWLEETKWLVCWKVSKYLDRRYQRY